MFYLCLKNSGMDDSITNIISNVGFPVAMCLLLFYYMEKQNERHKQETDKLNETLQGNTNVLTELTTLIKSFIQKWARKK